MGTPMTPIIRITWRCPLCAKEEAVEAQGLENARSLIDTLVQMHEWQACG
jgi:hypothetical protein